MNQVSKFLIGEFGSSIIRTGLIRTALAGMFSLGVFCNAVAPATACEQWKVSSPMSVFQQPAPMTPYDHIVKFYLTQSGTALKGHAEYYQWVNGGASHLGPLLGSGSAFGFIRGDNFQITARWSPGSVGVYSGTVDWEGHINGKTFDRVNPDVSAVWNTSGPLGCMTQASTPTTPPAAPPPTPADTTAETVPAPSEVETKNSAGDTGVVQKPSDWMKSKIFKTPPQTSVPTVGGDGNP